MAGEAGKKLHTGRSRNDQVGSCSRICAFSRKLLAIRMRVRVVVVVVFVIFFSHSDARRSPHM